MIVAWRNRRSTACCKIRSTRATSCGWRSVDEIQVSLHFPKESVVLSHNSTSHEKFMHGIKVLMAKNYIDNLSEEVKKGLREKAEQGHFPGVAHVGYVNNRVTHRIDVDPVRGALVTRVF